MFKSIRGWFGKSDEECQKEERKLPSEAKSDYSDGICTWLMTGDFVDPENGHIREYMAASRQENETEWTVYRYAADHRKDVLERSPYADNLTGEEVVQFLNEYGHSMRKAGKKDVPGTFANYRDYANEVGLHIDQTGHIFSFNPDTPLVNDVEFTKLMISKLFLAAAEKDTDIGSWDKFYRRMSDLRPKNDMAAEDMAKDPGFPAFVTTAKGMMAKLDRLPDYFSSHAGDKQAISSTLESMVETLIVDTTGFKNADCRAAAEFMTDITIFVGLVNAGAAIYERHVDSTVFKSNRDMLDLVRRVAGTAEQFGRRRLRLGEEEAATLGELIASGKDPEATQYPLAKYLGAYLTGEKPLDPADKFDL